jgi:hypothetical protein
MAAGCLSRIVSPGILEPVADLTAVLVEHAVRAGLD